VEELSDEFRPPPNPVAGVPCRCGAVGTIHEHAESHVCWRCGHDYDDREWAALMTVLRRRVVSED
jgi:hypothetical protein